MNQDLIHVYLMPGMAANPSIFEYIKLPEDIFKIHWLEWQLPLKDESLEAYAKRMLEHVEHDNSVLIGVSFGGILVQEMCRLRDFKKVIIISSVKNRSELPKRMRMAKTTGVYRLAPTQLAKNVDLLAKYAFGKTIKKRAELYKKYLSVNDKHYLDWALKQVVSWKRKEVIPDIIHIHGDKDVVFPIKNITNCITVKGGTHVMIINKYKWFNENLPDIILS